jgi:tRNA(Ile)-lysidine synthase
MGCVIRPFRTWSKKDIVAYARRNGVEWVEDPSNTDMRFKRNFIRHKVVPTLRELNPGLDNIVLRVIKEKDSYLL